MVSQDEINEMNRLNKIMKGERPPPTATSATTSAGAPNPNAIILQNGPTSADVADMAKIMENFSGATGVKSFRKLHDDASSVVNTLVKTSQTSPELREALITNKTNSGIQVGAWEISKHERKEITEKAEFYFTVHNINTGQKIKASFMIFESAHGVVKLLNNGADFSHPSIKKIAQYEIEYRKARKCALEEKHFWQRAKKKNSEFKMNLYEAKFDAAKTRALLIRERIINLCHQI